MSRYTHVVVTINTRNKTSKHRLQKVTACKTPEIAKAYQQLQIEGLPGYFEVKIFTQKQASSLGLKPIMLCREILANKTQLMEGL